MTYLLHEGDEDDELKGQEFGQWLVVLEVLFQRGVELQDCNDCNCNRNVDHNGTLCMSSQQPIRGTTRIDQTYPDMSEMDLIASQAVYVCCLSDVRNNGNEDGGDDVLEDCEPFFLICATGISKILGQWRECCSQTMVILLTLYHSKPSCRSPFALRLLGTSKAAKKTSRNWVLGETNSQRRRKKLPSAHA